MATTITDEIRDSFRKGSTLTKLIYINLAAFILSMLLLVVSTLFPMAELDLIQYLMVPSDVNRLIMRPWTIITYQFLHSGFLHILFNLLWLFWFGRIFLKYLTQKQLLNTYLIGGVFGCLLFVLSYNVFPGLIAGPFLLGASASVSAIVIGISVYAPNYTIRLFFIGDVKLKHIALVFIVLDVMQIVGDNPGGHISHLGGALYGYLFATRLKRGKDTGRGIGNFLDAVVSAFKPRPKMKVTYKNAARKMSDHDYNKERAVTQKEVDKILDKIAKSGYESLSKSEKETLFKMSNKS